MREFENNLLLPHTLALVLAQLLFHGLGSLSLAVGLAAHLCAIIIDSCEHLCVCVTVVVVVVVLVRSA